MKKLKATHTLHGEPVHVFGTKVIGPYTYVEYAYLDEWPDAVCLNVVDNFWPAAFTPATCVPGPARSIE